MYDMSASWSIFSRQQSEQRSNFSAINKTRLRQVTQSPTGRDSKAKGDAPVLTFRRFAPFEFRAFSALSNSVVERASSNDKFHKRPSKTLDPLLPSTHTQAKPVIDPFFTTKAEGMVLGLERSSRPMAEGSGLHNTRTKER
jgi:hypothetical protein